jgi:hypothetical protein
MLIINFGVLILMLILSKDRKDSEINFHFLMDPLLGNMVQHHYALPLKLDLSEMDLPHSIVHGL